MTIDASKQSTSLHQINTAISQMDQDAQKNAAMVKETTATTHNLKRGTEARISSMSSFKFATSARTCPQGLTAPSPRQKAIQIVKSANTALAHKIENAPDENDWEEF